MKAQENVYEKISRTGEVAEASEERARDRREEQEEKAPTVPSKFKDVDALARAYEALEAEFTKRSQRLKELERDAENFSLKKAQAESSGVEKLRKNAEARRAATKEFDEFLAEVGKAKDGKLAAKEEKPAKGEEEHSPEIRSAEDLPSDVEKNEATEAVLENEGTEWVEKEKAPLQTAVATEESREALQRERVEKPAEEKVAFSSVAENGNATNTSEELYAKVQKNEGVRLRIIGEYLASIGKAGAPLTVGNVGTIASPPVKAKSIGEAGGMALRYFKTSTRE